jgi:hypothetical protein
MLTSGDWLITLDSRHEISELSRGLKQRRGYAITHVGRLARADGKRFSRHAAANVLTDLHWFLSFVRGAWTSPLLIEGHGVKSSIWHSWAAPRVDPGDGGFSWADSTNWESVAQAYQGFARRCANPLWRQALRIAIGQYVTANHPSPLEPAIMAAQSGLELMGWLRLVESRIVRKRDWLSMSTYPASRKIGELLGRGSVDLAIPSQLSALVGLDPNWTTGPEVVAGVRNRLVHPRRTKRGVGWDPDVLFDAWLLASSYLELALLQTFHVRGPIRNRILSPSVWVGATVAPPWVP